MSSSNETGVAPRRWISAGGTNGSVAMTFAALPSGMETATTEGATVTGADHKRYHGADVEALTRQALGWELPVTRLQYWVRGEAAPGSVPQDVERDAEARISALRQDEWRIKLERYPADQHAGLPRRVDLDRGGNQSIRLVIDAWRGEAAP